MLGVDVVAVFETQGSFEWRADEIFSQHRKAEKGPHLCSGFPGKHGKNLGGFAGY